MTSELVPSLPPGSTASVGADAPIMEVLASMRAMRRLKPDPVPKEVLEQLIAAATWGPTAGDGQNYGYVVVTDRAQMARLAALWREVKTKYLTIVDRLDPQAATMPAAAGALAAIDYQAEHFEETPALIAICYSRQPVPRDARVAASLVRDLGLGFMLNAASKRMGLLAEASSCYPGAQNLLLAARALGLAANLTVWHLLEEQKFKQALGVPKDVTVYALVPVGWPAGKFGPVRRHPVNEVLHWDRW
ncbi:MAG TPA: nitroreductase family protein [Streptosporangiaceae bacterium]|nr:nitroreductase family protein [Streptosporangiaceae bacterium]